MFKNYFKIAFRNLMNYRMFSVINIFGLGIGFAFCLLSFLYISHEWSYDRFHKNGNHIYRLYKIVTNENQISHNIIHRFGVGEQLQDKFPGIQSTVRLVT